MATNTIQQIENINNSLKWIQKHKPEDYGQRFLQLVEERRKLKRVAEAENNNPGIAAFGKSQVGKSYLISCLLQDNGKPFLVKAGDKSYNFVFEINPPSEEGGGRESTGVVSRFSSFKRRPDDYNCDLPVLVNTFSLADVITILADTYFNDLNFDCPTQEVIEKMSEEFFDVYSTKKLVDKPVVSADEVLTMKDYFKRNINNAQAFSKSSFFDRLALVIERVPSAEYIAIFSKLWSNNANINRLYKKLYEILYKFDFARYLYLPIESVVHKGVRENTIMSVQCLKQLFFSPNEYVTDVYVKIGKTYEKRATNIAKSEICAVCSEIDFKIESDFLQSSGRYDLSGVDPEVKKRLNSGEVEMAMLEENDLLDFPGARSREQEKIEKLESDDVLLNCFLRGKVAYLFNKYNEEMAINILLYCHHNKDNDVTGLYKLLEEWVNNYVGKTPEERAKKIQMTNVSPLFYIGTMFNLDMQLGVGAEISELAINQRWTGRLDTVVNKQCFHSSTVDWVKNFTRQGESFKNSYMLRDFKFSGPKSGLYEGFKETQREQRMLMNKDYYDLMRKTFVENGYVKQFFGDPELSWDVAASINNDGALYIIEKLGIVARNMDKARQSDFDATLQAVADRVSAIMRQYYISDDTSELLDENIRKADEIFREMDFACQHRPEYFGHLISEIQLSEPECFKYLHDIIPTLNSSVHDPKADYELIRKRCKMFEGCRTDSDKWNVLIREYRFASQDAAEKYLSDKNIKVADLFKGEYIKRTNSAVITDGILKMWKKRFTEAALRMSDNGTDITMIDTPQMNYLTDCLIGAVLFVKLADRIESTISPFVDILDLNSINEYFVADMIASMVSNFVMDFGYSYLTDEQITNVKRICSENHLPCYNYMDKERQEDYDEDQATTLFNDILSLSECFTPAYEANYNSWLEYMYVAFIANLNVPEYDHEANDELRKLLEEIKK